jgi:DNA topoisomerase-2
MRALPSSGGADAAPTMASNNGVLEQRPGESPNVLHITELPVGTWTCKYKTLLEQMLEEKKIRTFREMHTDTRVHFVVELSSEQSSTAIADGRRKAGVVAAAAGAAAAAAAAAARAAAAAAAPPPPPPPPPPTPLQCLHASFELYSNLSLTDMVLFDTNGRLHRYASAQDIIRDFFKHRYPLFELRKRHRVRELEYVLQELSNRVRFIDAVVTRKLVVSGKRKDVLSRELHDAGYWRKPSRQTVETESKVTLAADSPSTSTDAHDYLLDMPILSLTHENAVALQKKHETRKQELHALREQTTRDM